MDYREPGKVFDKVTINFVQQNGYFVQRQLILPSDDQDSGSDTKPARSQSSKSSHSTVRHVVVAEALTMKYSNWYTDNMQSRASCNHD
jgi:hypothetical protein